LKALEEAAWLLITWKFFALFRFTCEELRVILEGSGFEVLTLITLDRYNYDIHKFQRDNYEQPATLHYTKEILETLLKSIGANLNHRGDNIYLVAKK
jgi:hypothetical protein